jgi:RsiW-degrading membrane proteinase PrsW (M82 family)
MIDPGGSTMTGKNTLHWPSLAQLGLSLLGVINLWGGSLGLLALVGISRFNPILPASTQQTETLLMLALGLALGGLLLIPSFVYSLRRLMNKPSPRPYRWEVLRWGFLIYAAALALGFLKISLGFGGKWLLPILHLIANGSILAGLLYVVFRKESPGSPQRFWGVLNSGLLLAPFLSIILEILVLLLLGLGWGLYLSRDPELLEQIISLVNRIPQSASSPAAMERMANRYLFQPGVLWTTFIYIGVLVPLVEELIKPIGVWLLAGRELSPREGFLLGMVSGAGYALFENLTLGNTPEMWVVISITRVGTTLIHIFTSGLVGWGLATAWKEKKYLRLGAAYLAAVTVHATWNLLSLYNSFGQFEGARGVFGDFGTRLAFLVPISLVILAAGALIGILQANTSAKRAIMARVQEN